jgi:hypothetical protein
MRFLLLVVHQILLWLMNECMTWAGLELKGITLSSRKTTGSFAYSSIGNPMKITCDFSNAYLSLLERERNQVMCDKQRAKAICTSAC